MLVRKGIDGGKQAGHLQIGGGTGICQTAREVRLFAVETNAAANQFHPKFLKQVQI